MQSTHPLIRTSQVSLSSNPDADFRYSTIFTPIGLYKGQLFAIKKVRKKNIDITREMKMELKLVSTGSRIFITTCIIISHLIVLSQFQSGYLIVLVENIICFFSIQYIYEVGTELTIHQTGSLLFK